MRNHEIRKYQMLMRVREFGAAHRDLFPARSVAGKLFAAVAAAADALQLDDSQELAARGGQKYGAASKAAARDALRRQLRAIAQTAAAAEAPGLGLGDKFRALLACSDERLLSQARTFLNEAKPFTETFVAHELPSNFLRQLQAAIVALEQSTSERESGRAQWAAARARIEATMDGAMQAVRRLSGIVPNKLDGPAAVALWDLAVRVDSGRVRNDQPAAPATPAPSAAA